MKNKKFDGTIFINTGIDPEDDTEHIKQLPPEVQKYAWKYFFVKQELGLYKIRDAVKTIVFNLQPVSPVTEKQKRKRTKRKNYYYAYPWDNMLESFYNLGDAIFMLDHKKISPSAKEREARYRELVGKNNSIQEIAQNMQISPGLVQKDLGILGIRLRKKIKKCR